MRSFSPVVEFTTCASPAQEPDMMRSTESWPAKGSARVLNTNMDRGASGEEGRSPSWPTKAGRSRGEGNRRWMESRTCAPPAICRAEPQDTGTRAPASTPARRATSISSGVSSPSSRYFSMRASSDSAMFSMVASRRVATSSARSAGTSASVTLPPSPNMRALPANTSTRPLKSSLDPMG